ncbi:hypothetical protein MNBD_ACTINO01-1329 [hydrothermal vent metagenome]|uniref:UBE2O-like SH3-C domain-containing protein n=1 Tax=hydrothermal vent metagenome TaxID=652676 RepID=A0A3B0SEN4_9ZZZZ
MIRKGDRVERLTKKVGQVAATGKVTEVRDAHYVEVQWDDGHTSVASKDGLVLLTDANRPHKDT